MGDKKNSFTYRLKKYLASNNEQVLDNDLKSVSIKFVLDGISIDVSNYAELQRIIYLNDLINEISAYNLPTSEKVLKDIRNIIQLTSNDWKKRNNSFTPRYKTHIDKDVVEYAQQMQLDSTETMQLNQRYKFDNEVKKKVKDVINKPKQQRKDPTKGVIVQPIISSKPVDNNDEKKDIKNGRLTVKEVKHKLENKEIGKCKQCPLYKEKRIVGLGSNAEYMDEVEVLIIGEAPAEEEIKQGSPFVGSSGKLIREVINNYPDIKYLITNATLCFHKPGNKPTETELISCEPNLDYVISNLPNLRRVILVGKVAVSRALKNYNLNFKITKYHGNVLDDTALNLSDNVEVFVVFHPSYARRNPRNLDVFIDSFSKVFSGNIVKISEDISERTILIRPPKYFMKVKTVNEIITYMDSQEDSYTLVDVQKISKANAKYSDYGIIFIVRGVSGKKYFFYINTPFFTFWYSDIANDFAVKSVKELKQIQTKYSEKYFRIDELKKKLNNNLTLYQSDYSLDSFYSNRWYRRKTREDDSIKLRYFIFDIEIMLDTNFVESGIDQKNLKHPIICYTYYDSYEDKYTFVYNHEWAKKSELDLEKVKTEYSDINLDVKEYRTEKAMIKDFFKIVESINPDVITNWNVQFDFDSMVSRYKHYFGEFPKINGAKIGIHPKYGANFVAGIVMMDYLSIYKSNDYTKKENYKLDTISDIELGERKTAYEGTLSKLFEEDKTTAVIYNVNDVILVKKINDKRKLIDITNTLRKVAATSWNAAMRYIGIQLIDSTLIYRANNQGLVIVDANYDQVSSKYEGAFVLNPKKLIPQWMIVYDLASLYPHVMSRYNLEKTTYYLKIHDENIAFNLIHDKNKVDMDQHVKVTFYPYTYKETTKTMTVGELYNTIMEENLIITRTGVCLLPHTKRKSIIYTTIDELYSKRLYHKDLVKKAETELDKQINDLYQYTYKIDMNAIYGVQGNDKFRLYNKDLARTITLSAQEVSRFCAYHVHKYIQKLKQGITDYEIELESDFFKEEMDNVQYMDTDSIFVLIDELLDPNKSDEENFKQVEHYSKLILGFFNDYLLPRLIKMHNLDPSDNIFNFNFKIEYFVRNAIMPVKKAYAVRIIDKDRDGNIIYKYKFKGLSVVRSDYPQWTKSMLKEFVKLILEENIIEDKERLTKWIITKYNEAKHLIESGDFSIARQLGLSKSFEDYSAINESVKGAITWNYLVYDHFRITDKGYHFYIKEINRDNLVNLSTIITNKAEYQTQMHKLTDELTRLAKNARMKNKNSKNKPDSSFEVKFKKKLKLDSILIPIDAKPDEPSLNKLPIDIFVPDVEKMMKNVFIARINQFIEPLGIDIMELLGFKKELKRLNEKVRNSSLIML